MYSHRIILFVFILVCNLNCPAFANKSSENLNPAEKYVIEQVEKGEVADFSGIPEDNSILSADFLKKLLTGALFGLEVTETGISIVGARIKEKLDFGNTKIAFPITLETCIFYKYIDLYQTTFFRKADFSETKFIGYTNFKDAKFSGEASFWETEFSEAAYFPETKFSGAVDFENVKFSGEANFEKTKFAGETSFRNAEFTGAANFEDTKFSGKTTFEDAKFSGEADFIGTKFSEEANFKDAKFSNEASFWEAEFSRKADFLKSKFLGGANFWDTKFSGEASFWDAEFTGAADFDGVEFTGAANFENVLFSSGAFFWNIEFPGAANFENAKFSGNASFWDAKFSGKANFSKADLHKADLRRADLHDADLSAAKLSEALLREANLKGCLLWNVQGFSYNYEPKAGSPPYIPSIATFPNLSELTYKESPHGLVDLREGFKKWGYRKQEREITYAIKHKQRIKLWYDKESRIWGKIESFFYYLLFELTCQYGMKPGRPLITLFSFLFFPFTFLYILALVTKSKKIGLWIVFPKEKISKGVRGTHYSVRLRADEERLRRLSTRLLCNNVPNEKKLNVKKEVFRWYRVVRIAFFFSLLSAFGIGWRELNVGNWLTRIQRREYLLRATGWARMFSGIQSLLSVYLLALWVLIYFGRPFEAI